MIVGKNIYLKENYPFGKGRGEISFWTDYQYELKITISNPYYGTWVLNNRYTNFILPAGIYDYMAEAKDVVWKGRFEIRESVFQTLKLIGNDNSQQQQKNIENPANYVKHEKEIDEKSLLEQKDLGDKSNTNWDKGLDMDYSENESKQFEDNPIPKNVAVNKLVTITTNGAEDENIGEDESPEDITDGDLTYLPASLQKEDGVIGFVNNDYNQLMEIKLKINLGTTYKISRIRYNQGNVQHGDSWNADLMETPFGSISTKSGSNYLGAWTEQSGNIILSEITVTLKKTRLSFASDWLFIGEIEVYGISVSKYKASEINVDSSLNSIALSTKVALNYQQAVKQKSIIIVIIIILTNLNV